MRPPNRPPAPRARDCGRRPKSCRRGTGGGCLAPSSELGRTRKSILTPRLKYRHCCRIGQIETALTGTHRQAYASLRSKPGQNLGRQTTSLRAKYQHITRHKLHGGQQGCPLGRHREPTPSGPPSIEVRPHGLPVVMHADLRVLVIIQPRTAQGLVLKRKAQRPHQMQATAGVGRKADDVAGIGRDLGMIQNYFKEGSRIP